jgi:hypothetical protein
MYFVYFSFSWLGRGTSKKRRSQQKENDGKCQLQLYPPIDVVCLFSIKCVFIYHQTTTELTSETMDSFLITIDIHYVGKSVVHYINLEEAY